MNESQFPDEERLRAVFRAPGEHRVEYAVFGAEALGLHGLRSRRETTTVSP